MAGIKLYNQERIRKLDGRKLQILRNIKNKYDEDPRDKRKS